MSLFIQFKRFGKFGCHYVAAKFPSWEMTETTILGKDCTCFRIRQVSVLGSVLHNT